MWLSTLCFLLVTPHRDGFSCSIEVLFSIFLSVFLKHFHLFYEGFVIITLTFWTLVNTFQMFYFHFKSNLFFQKLSKFANPLSSYVIFKIWFAPHINGCSPIFLLPWGADTIFRSDWHHIQMHATQLSCCHGVLIQILGLIRTLVAHEVLM